MNLFSYDGPLIQMLNRVANMMMVSFFWIVCCLPVITIVPASAALYLTTASVIRGSGSGVAGAFFRCFKANLKQGCILTLLVITSGLVLYTCLDFGRQIAGTGWGLAYLVVGFVLSIFWCAAVLYLPPVLSRFECGIGIMLRLALYLPMTRFFRTCLSLALLAAVIFLVDFYPVLLLLLPGVYADLLCGGMEKSMTAFARRNGLPPRTEEESNIEVPEVREISALEQASAMEEDPPV